MRRAERARAACAALTSKALLAPALVAVALLAPAPAAACYNGVIYVVDPQVVRLRRAERLMESGEHGAALRLVAGRTFSDAGRARRAQLIDAVARVRLLARSGPLDPLLLRHPIALLRDLHTQDPLSLRVRARLAEALLLTPEGEAEARALLEPLVANDVVPDAEAWLTIGALRALAGDVDGRTRALQRCERVAGLRRGVCRPLRDVS